MRRTTTLSLENTKGADSLHMSIRTMSPPSFGSLEAIHMLRTSAGLYIWMASRSRSVTAAEVELQGRMSNYSNLLIVVVVLDYHLC